MREGREDMRYGRLSRSIRSILTAPVLMFLAASCSVTRHIPTDYPQLPEEFGNCSGRLETVIHRTSVPGPSERRMYVYLPAGYSDTSAARPVLYLLHGARGNETVWIRKGGVLSKIDSLRACGSIPDMIIAFPNVNSYADDRDFAKSRIKGAVESFYEVDGCVESSFVKDMVGTVDSLFNTVRSAEGRAIAGLSLGGMQSLYLAAAYPEVFGYAGIFSSPVHSFIRKGTYSGFYKGLDRRLDAISANDSPFWDIYVGRNDIYCSSMKKFSRDLERRGLPHRFHLEEGGHQWPQWTSFVCSFMQSVFRD